MTALEYEVSTMYQQIPIESAWVNHEGETCIALGLALLAHDGEPVLLVCHVQDLGDGSPIRVELVDRFLARHVRLLVGPDIN